MDEIAIIRDKEELDGTGYIEIVPGKYQGKHWQEGSLFFDEELFGYIESIFERNINGYDHYEMNDGTKEEWLKVIDELEELNNHLSKCNEFSSLQGKVGFVFAGTRDRFQINFEVSKNKLINVNQELIAWAKETIKANDHIAILGV